jgi:hypothetical protein
MTTDVIPILHVADALATAHYRLRIATATTSPAP